MKINLIWDDKKGIGFHPGTSDGIYDENYFNRYVELGVSEIGCKITDMRTRLVKKWINEAVNILDFGIGSGIFLQTLGRGYGYDINPCGVSWLKERNIFFDPYDHNVVENICFWDTLEHVIDPINILNKVNNFVFMSIPIFDDLYSVLASKHFKPNEHFWYFTHDGLIQFMNHNGFLLEEYCNMEQDAGRQGIKTYVFQRK